MSDTWPKKTNPKAKKKSHVLLSIRSSFSDFGTLSLTTPETHIKSDPIFRNHRLYNTENQEKKKVTGDPSTTLNGRPVSANPKWFSSPILVPLLHTIAGKFWIPLMLRGERERERERGRREISEIWRTELGLVWMSLGLGLKAQPTIAPTLFCFSFFLIFFNF